MYTDTVDRSMFISHILQLQFWGKFNVAGCVEGDTTARNVKERMHIFRDACAFVCL